MLTGQSKSIEIEELKKQVCGCFQIGDLFEAGKLLNRAHALDFNDKEIKVAMSACGFWDQRVQKISSIACDGARGDFFRYQWGVFEEHYREKREHSLDEGFSSLKFWVHSEALKYYQDQIKATGDEDSILRASSCLKILGHYDEAIENLEYMLRISNTENVSCMAELADAYVLIGEDIAGKALIREALFLDAPKVDINSLTSPLFRKLIELMETELSADSEVFNYWLPVYGVVWGGLDVKRELSEVEYEKLNQMIYALSNEIADGDKSGRLTPQLINAYFRLADHYQLSGADRFLIEETLINIKFFAPEFYRKHFR